MKRMMGRVFICLEKSTWMVWLRARICIKGSSLSCKAALRLYWRHYAEVGMMVGVACWCTHRMVVI